MISHIGNPYFKWTNGFLIHYSTNICDAEETKQNLDLVFINQQLSGISSGKT